MKTHLIYFKNILFLIAMFFVINGIQAQTGEIRGRILSLENEALSDVNITLEGTSLGNTTDANGNFAITNIPAGTYTLRASSVGYSAAKQNVIVKAGESLNLNLQLSQNNTILDEVLVSAQKQESYSSYSHPEVNALATRSSVPLLETPQAVQVIPRQLWQDQIALNTNEVSRNMVGVANSSAYNLMYIRGFRYWSPGTFMITNGLRGNIYHFSQPVLLYNVEQIEILRGPASVLYANNAPGGVINIATKQPLDKARYEVNLTTGSWDLFTGFLDATGPITEKLKYRIVVGGEKSNSYRDFQFRENLLINPTLRYDISNKTSLTADFNYLRMNTQAQYDRGTYVKLKADGKNYDFDNVDRSFTPQGPDSEGNDRNWATSLNFKHQFSDKFSVQLLSRYVERELYMFEAVSSGNLNKTQDTLSRYGATWDFNNTWWNSTLFATLEFNTGKAIKHQLLIGGDYILEEEPENFYTNRNLPKLNLLNPDYSQDRAFFFNPDNKLTYAEHFTVERTNIAGYIQDQISVGDKLVFNLALRYNDYKYYQEPQSELDDEGAVVESEADAWIPRVGVVFKPVKNIAVYGSYTESFEPQNANSESRGGPFPPRVGKQYEVGYKGDFLNNTLSTSVAWYFIDYVNVLASDPSDPQLRRQIVVPGLTSTGIELSVQGNLSENLSVIANYATMNVKFVADSPLGARANRQFNTPDYLGNVWMKYNFTQICNGLGIGAGVSFQGDKIGQRSPYDGNFVLPAWNTIDATVDYRFKNYRLGFSLNNILDEKYIVGANRPNFIFPGAPRNFRVNLTAVF